MTQRLTVIRFDQLRGVKSDHMYSVQLEWSAHFVKKIPEKAVSYLNKCLDSSPWDSNALCLRSVGKRRLAQIDSALEDALAAGMVDSTNPGISLEICDGLYDQNQFETCMVELHDNIGKYLSAVVDDFHDRLVVVHENFKDTMGESLGSFFSKNLLVFPTVAEIIRRKAIFKPRWKILRDEGECDVVSLEEEKEKLISPLELARRKRRRGIYGQIYFGRNRHDEVFLRELPKNQKWKIPGVTSSTPFLEDQLIKPAYTVVDKFIRMLHARSPLYNEYHKLGIEKFLKKHREQYLYRIQWQTRRRMFTVLRKIKEHRKNGEIEAMTRYAEANMGDVNLKTSRTMPWKFEFVNEVYKIIGLAHADTYIVTPYFNFGLGEPFLNLQRLLKVKPKLEQSSVTYEFGNVLTSTSSQSDDPKIEKMKGLISDLEKRLVFSQYSIEKCYLYHEMGRANLKLHRFDECNSMARKAIEEAKNCKSLLWTFLSQMLAVKAFTFSKKIEYCHEALLDAYKAAAPLKSPNIMTFVKLAISISESIIERKKRLLSMDKTT